MQHRQNSFKINRQFVSAKRINVREYRMDNQKWTIQGNWQHRVHKTKDRHVLDTTLPKQTQIT